MIIFVDMDETICHRSEEHKQNYEKSEPYLERIEKINKLYDEGHTIMYWTARGSRSGINWFTVTYKQLQDWGCKFHELRLGKPHYDLYIDDKSINCNEYFK